MCHCIFLIYQLTSWYTQRCWVNKVKKMSVVGVPRRHPLSPVVTHCTSSSSVVIRYRSLSPVITRCHSLSPVVTRRVPLPLIVIRFYPLSPVVIRFHPSSLAAIRHYPLSPVLPSSLRDSYYVYINVNFLSLTSF